jgi:hypothetical protein
MEVSFSKEIESLRLGDGETFHGEGILAITKGCCSRAWPMWAATRARRCRT